MSIWLFSSALVFIAFSLRKYVQTDFRNAVRFLLTGAFLLRIAAAMLDTFLHDWDEKFHALVAKNMMADPFTPMLRAHPVLPYDYTAWCCNHIWVHKQPLFMWQMALSMKIFGVNELAIRSPSVLLSTAMVWCVYRIALIWTKQQDTGYIAALLSACAFYQIELTSGLLSLDHNDLVFTAYVTGSIWAFCEYVEQRSWRWVLLTGIMAGCAILVKWLTGLLVFGGWGLWLFLQKPNRMLLKKYRDLFIAIAVSAAIALPWQLYILAAFPKESAYEYGYNYAHITSTLGAYVSEGWTFHFNQWPEQYGKILLPLLLIGLLLLFRSEGWKSKLTVPMLAMAMVVYVFFSFLVQTKMPAFVYIVCPILLSIIAMGARRLLAILDRFSLNKRWMHVPVLLILMLNALQPWAMRKYRNPDDKERNAKIHNTHIFKNLNSVPPDYLVFNCKSFEDVDLMFYSNYNAHSWCPSKEQVNSLLQAGYKIAVFQAHKGKKLPDYIESDTRLLFIKEEME